MVHLRIAKKAKRGRPKLPRGTNRGCVITLRLKAGERKSVVSAAERAGKTLSEWIREALLSTAATVNMETAESGGGGNPTPPSETGSFGGL